MYTWMLQVFHEAAGSMTRKVRIAEEVDYDVAPPAALERTKTEGSEQASGGAAATEGSGKFCPFLFRMSSCLGFHT